MAKWDVGEGFSKFFPGKTVRGWIFDFLNVIFLFGVVDLAPFFFEFRNGAFEICECFGKATVNNGN